MSKVKHYEGQLPLMASIEKVESVVEVPMEFNSKVELSYFEQSMLGIVPEDKRGTLQVKQSIDSIYSAYYGVVNATRTLASAVYAFCELTGCEYSEVSSALSKGLQKQLDKSWISKLYHAGKVMSLNPVAKRITDIEKLALVGRLDENQIKNALSEQGGQAMIGDKFVSLMKRDEFRSKLVELSPEKFPEPKAKPWDITGFRAHVDAAINANTADGRLTDQLKAVLATLDLKIKAIEETKLAERERAKAARKVDASLRATA